MAGAQSSNSLVTAGYQAEVLMAAGGSFSFAVNSPTLWTSSLTGNVAQMPDPSGFTYASLGYSLGSESTNQVLFTTNYRAAGATTSLDFSATESVLLQPGVYYFDMTATTTDLTTPSALGTWTQSSFGDIQINLQSVPEPSTLTLGASALVIGLVALCFRKHCPDQLFT